MKNSIKRKKKKKLLVNYIKKKIKFFINLFIDTSKKNNFFHFHA
jgi:hypothetical protein